MESSTGNKQDSVLDNFRLANNYSCKDEMLRKLRSNSIITLACLDLSAESSHSRL